MGSYEIIVKMEEIRKRMDEEDYESAQRVLDTIDLKKVKNPIDISLIADVYTENGRFEEALTMLLKIYNRSKTKKTLYQLTKLMIKMGEIEEAQFYLNEYGKVAPRDVHRYIFQYKIDKLKGEAFEELIETLETLKELEYTEHWAYELAKLYYKAGKEKECVKECTDIILLFGEGIYVEKAKLLRAYFTGEADKTVILENLKRRTEGSETLIDESLESSQVEVEEKLHDKKSEKNSDIIHNEVGHGKEELPEVMQDADYALEDALKEEISKNFPDYNHGEAIYDSEDEPDKKLEDNYEYDVYVAEDTQRYGINEKEVMKEQDKENHQDSYDEQEDDELQEIVKGNIFQKFSRLFSKDKGQKRRKKDSDVSRMDEEQISWEDQYRGRKQEVKQEIKHDIKQNKMQEVKQDIVHDLEQEESIKQIEGIKQKEGIHNNRKYEEDGVNEKLLNSEGVDADRNEIYTDIDQETAIGQEYLKEQDYSNINGNSGYQNEDNFLYFSHTAGTSMDAIFGDFMKSASIRNQIYQTLDSLLDERNTSIQVMVTGSDSSDTFAMAKNYAAFLHRAGKLNTSKVAKITAVKLNNMDILSKKDSLRDCCLYIENASILNAGSIDQIILLSQNLRGSIAVIIEGKMDAMNIFLRENPKFLVLFRNRIHLSQY